MTRNAHPECMYTQLHFDLRDLLLDKNRGTTFFSLASRIVLLTSSAVRLVKWILLHISSAPRLLHPDGAELTFKIAAALILHCSESGTVTKELVQFYGILMFCPQINAENQTSQKRTTYFSCARCVALQLKTGQNRANILFLV